MTGHPLEHYFQPQDRSHSRRHIAGPIVGVVGIGLLLAGTLFSVRWLDENVFVQQEHCSVVLSSERESIAPDQTKNSAIIAAAGLRRDLGEHEVKIALATARQESKLRNIDYGDAAGPDSRGLFQQRPSMGWGTEEQILDPWYAADRFYQELETIPDYADLPLTEAAQAVQRSAFPDAYAKHEEFAALFSQALTSGQPGTMNCVLRPVTEDENVSVEALSNELTDFGFGLPSKTSATVLEYTPTDEESGWRQATWALALAKDAGIVKLRYNGLVWERDKRGWVKDPEPSSTLEITLAQ